MDKWIKCSDQMPEVRKVCLLYITYPPGTMFNCRADPFPRQNIRLGGRDYTGKWISYEHQYPKSEFEYIRHVSHWMELPEPPRSIDLPIQ